MGYRDTSRSSTASSSPHHHSGSGTPHRSAQNSPSVLSAAATPSHSPVSHVSGQFPSPRSHAPPHMSPAPHMSTASHISPAPPVHFTPDNRTPVSRLSPFSAVTRPHQPVPPPSSVIDLTGLNDNSPVEESARKKRKLEIDTSYQSLSHAVPVKAEVGPTSVSSPAVPISHATPTKPIHLPPIIASAANALFVMPASFTAAGAAAATSVPAAESAATLLPPASAMQVELSDVQAPTPATAASTTQVDSQPGNQPPAPPSSVSSTQLEASSEVHDPAPSHSNSGSPVDEPEEADDDAEEGPELDEDGQCSVRYCLEQAFDDDPGDAAIVWCLMCKKRYDWLKSQNKPCPVPVPFKREEPSLMVEHCEKDHPRGWEMLRSGGLA